MAMSLTVAAATAMPLAVAQTAAERQASDKESPTNVSAEQMTGRPDREVILERDVEITRGETTVNADHATYWIEEDEVEADGNVRMTRFGDRYTGDKMRLKMDTGEGYVENPTYHMRANNAHGTADRMDFESQERARVSSGTYSTCEGPDPDWYLKSDTMTFDKGLDTGTASSAVIYFKDVPIIGTPYISFPLSDERKSGFLPPSIGTSSRGGLEIMTPYYFNIAPNRDFTLSPRFIARRGVMLGGDARYLGEDYSGETKFEYLGNDRQTGTDRYSISTQHLQKLSPEASFRWNLNAASDDDYPSDFSQNLATSTERLLLRDLSFSYKGSFWTATARATNYQVLQDPDAPITRPYDRLPQLTWNAKQYDVNGFDWATTVQATSFYHPDLVRGDRFVVNPSISYPIVRPGYFLTPKVSLTATGYNLQDAGTLYDSDPGYAVPTFSLDTGLVFERDTNLFGNSMTQTLEPRLFYVKTPYRDQSRTPIFDTGEADLSFAQIFSENRFVGYDRISDADQLTAALVTRYLELDGAERVRLAIGQRFYFEDQRVTLPNQVTSTDTKSDLLASAAVRFSDALSTEATIQYSATQKDVTRANYTVSWRPEPKKVLNLSYRIDVPNELRQIDVSGQWPIADRWYGVARVNYSLDNDYAERNAVPLNVPPANGLSEGLLGLEYKADCWIFRIVAQRVPTSTGESNSSLFFQLELSGLAKLGSDPLSALRTSIPGYQPISNQSDTNHSGM